LPGFLGFGDTPTDRKLISLKWTRAWRCNGLFPAASSRRWVTSRGISCGSPARPGNN